MKKAKVAQVEKFKTAREFGRALGLSDLDLEMIRQKKRLIEKLRDTRTKRGISQAALAVRVGSKQPAIARMESGQVSDVSMDFLLKVALALEVPVTIKAQAKVTKEAA